MKIIPVRSLKERDPVTPESFLIRDLRAMKDVVRDSHRHDFFFVLALKKGRGSHEIDFVSHTVRDYSIFFIRPGQVHKLQLKAGSIGYIMQFDIDFYAPPDNAARTLLRRAGDRNYCQLTASAFRELFSTLTTIFHEYTEKREGYREVIRASLSIFIIGLVRNRRRRAEIPHENFYEQKRLDEFCELLEINFALQKQPSYYAEKLNLSLYQLNAITKLMLGKTCSVLIQDRIILETKRYLLATTYQISQIAYHLGYDDPSYFIRFFKKHTGQSPEMFRANFR